MAEKRTVKFDDEGRSRLTVRTIEVGVMDGPDEGVTFVTETDELTIGSAKGNGLVLTDPTVSRYHAELKLSDEGIVVRDHASTNGTFVGPVRIHDAVLPPGTVLRVGRTTLRVGAGKSVDIELLPEDRLGHLLGRSESMRRLMLQVRKVARTEAPSLIVGESGTGKELIASAIHDLGPRTKGPFVTVDCGAMSPNLVASELFGHERGAFTGADRQHIGAFERANGGTIFLDEIGELPPELQPNLLGALERKRFRRVGGRTDIDVDVRIVAATNRDLRAEVNEGRFRLDLYYRLAVVTLRVAPLPRAARRSAAADRALPGGVRAQRAGGRGVRRRAHGQPAGASLARERARAAQPGGGHAGHGRGAPARDLRAARRRRRAQRHAQQREARYGLPAGRAAGARPRVQRGARAGPAGLRGALPQALAREVGRERGQGRARGQDGSLAPVPPLVSA
ncbi:MAG: sigma 54-interacting transcriptional regulator [Sandaracinaceae bacterium]|nr:sigma 54-interacting transcriptional regulator [Sandaracinaceae bacterium]